VVGLVTESDRQILVAMDRDVGEMLALSRGAGQIALAAVTAAPVE